MRGHVFATASLALSLLAPGLLAQAAGPFDLNEGLALSHSDSEHPETPHLYAVDLWAKTGRTYVVEETEDLAAPSWRRLPLLIVGNDTRYGKRFAYADWNADAFHSVDPNFLKFEASGKRQFVRLRYVDWLVDPLHGDHDRDGVSNLDEAGDVYSLAAAQTDPFGYPDEDTATDADAD